MARPYLLPSPFGAAPSPPAGVRTLPDIFAHRARLQPGATCFSFQADGDVTRAAAQLTYGEALEIVLETSSHLRERLGAAAQAPVVAVWLEKSLELPLAVLTATFAGATWLPFDHDAPAARVTVCMQDAGVSVLICDEEHEARARAAASAAAGSPIEVHTFAQLRASAARTPARTPAPRPSEDATAYIIYTSGTTGTPKGIAIPHSAALRFLLSENAVLGIRADDVVWAGFSPAFDMWVESVWIALAAGAHVVLGSRSQCLDVTSLGGADGVWAQRGVTVVHAVPSLMGILTMDESSASGSELPRCLRLVNLGGEACPPALVARLWRPDLRLWNTYGPTETTVSCTIAELRPHEPVTIGATLPGYTGLLLPIDDGEGTSARRALEPLRPAPGTEGELVIGGPCVGSGYVGRPALTAEKFIVIDGQRCYRTGDRCRLDGQGQLAFLGRIDTQVKHRGFRIELGEIEGQLCSQAGVQAAAVILAGPEGSQRLEGYVVRQQGSSGTAGLREGLKASLPSYMIPEAFFELSKEEMPRLPSGKINAKGLHDISAKRRAQEEAAQAQISAAKSVASQESGNLTLDRILDGLASVFPHCKQVLAQDDIFDDLGGHSLVCAVLVSRLRCHPGLKQLGLADIYECRTAEAIAARFSDVDAASEFDEKTTLSAAAPPRDRPVSALRHALCGTAQLPVILFLFFIVSLEILMPYLLFDFLLSYGVASAIFGAYGVFVVLPPAVALCGVLGKWAFLGHAREGSHRLWGFQYFRWWAADRFTDLVPVKAIAESPLYPTMLRLLGAKIGAHCHLGHMQIGAAADLVSIGDDAVVGSDVVLSVSVVDETGRLVMRPVHIGNGASIGSNSLLEGGSRVEDDGELAPMSMLPSGATVPSGERWCGSPARFERLVADVGHGRASRPSFWRRACLTVAYTLLAALALPALYLAPQIPGLMLYDYVQPRNTTHWAWVAIAGIPVACGYIVLVFVELVAVRWLVRGRQLVPGTYPTASLFYVRKWFTDRVMDASLDILHPVYATLYAVPFLRAVGVQIGHGAEVSTARGINELSVIGDEAFIADAVLMGDSEIRGNKLTLKVTTMEPRSFAGNASLLPAGTTLGTGSLVGVLSLPPAGQPLEAGTSCFGSPAVLMPRRQELSQTYDDKTLFSPTPWLRAQRLFIEGLRIVLPRIVIVYGLGFGVFLFEDLWNRIGWAAVATLPIFYFFLFALPAVGLTILAKWILVGAYRPDAWPLWSLNVWLSEAVTSTFETLAEPLCLSHLVGTPFLPTIFWLLGTNMGKRVFLGAADITEYDLVSIGDYAAVNAHAGPQSHLFQDRVMAMDHVRIGAGATMKPYSIALPGSVVMAGATLGSLSLLMKGETADGGVVWEGIPVRPRVPVRPVKSAAV